MRIEGSQRVQTAVARNVGRGSGEGFSVPAESTQAARAGATMQAAPVASLDALLALQAVEDPLLRKRKLIRRGRSLLDVLEAVRADLLLGVVGEGRLNQLMALIGQAREASEPGLDALIDDIELRVRVELAKRGLFPALRQGENGGFTC
jgi:hypothetical protein